MCGGKFTSSSNWKYNNYLSLSLIDVWYYWRIIEVMNCIIERINSIINMMNNIISLINKQFWVRLYSENSNSKFDPFVIFSSFNNTSTFCRKKELIFLQFPNMLVLCYMVKLCKRFHNYYQYLCMDYSAEFSSTLQT